MNLKQLILAFLSPRHPAVYTEQSITQRVNSSPMSDSRHTPEQVFDTLRDLKKLGLVDLSVDTLDNATYWGATEEGIKRWTLDGRMTI